jgi:hypothetical protein
MMPLGTRFRSVASPLGTTGRLSFFFRFMVLMEGMSAGSTTRPCDCERGAEAEAEEEEEDRGVMSSTGGTNLEQ